MNFVSDWGSARMENSTSTLGSSITSTQNDSVEVPRSVSGLKRTQNSPAEAVPVKQLCVTQDNEEELKVKRRKVALLLSYSGQGYFGMQRNPNMKTIEEDLLLALLKAGSMKEEGFDRPQAVNFQRSCRTDKGVSAARQVVSVKLAVEDDTVEKINSHLPPQIRAMGLIRVTKKFNSKTSCDARTYTYMMPSFAFAPPTDNPHEDYRICEDLINEVNKILQSYKGSHNYHNFTARKKPMDPSAVRFIMEAECGQPFIRDGLEFVIITVKGQSFMLHQIRKMVGLIVTIMRGFISKEALEKVWDEEKLDIPIAPGVGLVLEEVHYDMYNRRYGSDGMHTCLTWDHANEKVKQFKESYIYPNIIEAEKNEKSMLNWLETLPFHCFDDKESEDSPPLTEVLDTSAADSDGDREVKSVTIEEPVGSEKSECVLTENHENILTDSGSEMKPMINKNEIHTVQPLNRQQTDIQTDSKS